jgi:hypothetical protein
MEKIDIKEWPDSSGEDDHGRDGGGSPAGAGKVAEAHGYKKTSSQANKTYYQKSTKGGGKATVSVDNHTGQWAHMDNGAGQSGTNAEGLDKHLGQYHGKGPQLSGKVKESSMDYMSEAYNSDSSFEGIRSKVCDALMSQERLEANSMDVYPWVQNMYQDQVVYSVGGEYYMRPYAQDQDGDVHFGPKQEVEQTWTPTNDGDEAQESMQESARVQCAMVQQLNEAYDAAKGELTITVIQPGFNSSKSRYYPADVLKRDYKIFEGAKMFADHATDAEAKARPEGSVNNWVASLKKVWAESDGRIRATAAVIDPQFKSKLDALNSQGLIKDMGISIRAVGEARREKVEGTETNYVESLLRGRSVDFVTFAGAGGMVEAMESERSEGDLDLTTLAELRQRRPDLVKAVENSAKSLQESEAMKTLEQQLQEAKAENVQLAAKVTTLETKINEAEKAAKVKAAGEELAKLLVESKLPQPAQDRLKKQFEGKESTEGMKEAVESEALYVKSIAPTAKVTGLGSKENVQEGEGSDKKVNLVESYLQMGLSKEQAEIAAGK